MDSPSTGISTDVFIKTGVQVNFTAVVNTGQADLFTLEVDGETLTNTEASIVYTFDSVSSDAFDLMRFCFGFVFVGGSNEGGDFRSYILSVEWVSILFIRLKKRSLFWVVMRKDDFRSFILSVQWVSINFLFCSSWGCMIFDRLYSSVQWVSNLFFHFFHLGW